MTDLTQARLKKLLDYDPETGVWRWRINRYAGQYYKQVVAKAGAVAGATNAAGYRQIAIDGRVHYEHRLAVLYMTGEWPPHQVDHVNTAKSDNRWANLRCCTRSQNKANTRTPKTNRSGFKGVSWHRGAQKWRAELSGRFLGYHARLEDAAAVYRAKARELYGEFARTNDDEPPLLALAERQTPADKKRASR